MEFDPEYRNPNVLMDLVRSADVVLLPYDSTEQATSGVLIEAIAAGRPIVATRFPHAGELLADGAGLLSRAASARRRRRTHRSTAAGRRVALAGTLAQLRERRPRRGPHRRRPPPGRRAPARRRPDHAGLAAGCWLLAAGCWLLDAQTRDGHLSLTPAGGHGRGWTGPGFDQQPIEAAALADACARALAVTGADRWEAGLAAATTWFLGTNDSGIPLADQRTGGCRDGLERDGCNENQGAESTLALISTLQHGRKWPQGSV